jgi:O-methyltransferase involved in polyketide biosynthesis
MSETSQQNLSGVAETLLIPLYNRAMESQRPDAMMKDEKAVALVMQMSYDFDQVRKIRMTEGNKVTRIMLTREMDRYAQDFLGRHPEAVVVHIGCGLDSRFDRVDNDQVEWYDLDLPEVIELRRKLVGGAPRRRPTTRASGPSSGDSPLAEPSSPALIWTSPSPATIRPTGATTRPPGRKKPPMTAGAPAPTRS